MSQADLDRCDREIERLAREVKSRVDPVGAYLGLQDWQYERRLIEREIFQSAIDNREK